MEVRGQHHGDVERPAVGVAGAAGADDRRFRAQAGGLVIRCHGLLLPPCSDALGMGLPTLVNMDRRWRYGPVTTLSRPTCNGENGCGKTVTLSSPGRSAQSN